MSIWKTCEFKGCEHRFIPKGAISGRPVYCSRHIGLVVSPIPTLEELNKRFIEPRIAPLKEALERPGTIRCEQCNGNGYWNGGILCDDCRGAGRGAGVVAHPAPEQNGGLKFDTDKSRMDLIDGEAMEELAKVLTFGAKKYAEHNWRKGITLSRLLAALLRHAYAILRGEDTDEETGLPHAAHAMCCCMFLLWTMKHRRDMDDRFKHEMTASEVASRMKKLLEGK